MVYCYFATCYSHYAIFANCNWYFFHDVSNFCLLK